MRLALRVFARSAESVEDAETWRSRVGVDLLRRRSMLACRLDALCFSDGEVSRASRAYLCDSVARPVRVQRAVTDLGEDIAVGGAGSLQMECFCSVADARADLPCADGA